MYRGTRSILYGILWSFPCSRRAALLPSSAQSDVGAVSGSCGTGPPGLCPELRTQSEWESEGKHKEGVAHGLLILHMLSHIHLLWLPTLLAAPA